MAASTEITSVWKQNFLHQFEAFDSCLCHFQIISFDTEFPGFLRNTPRLVPENILYDNLKYNVDNLKIIQLGITLSDEIGNIGGTWEFNFSDFDEKTDAHNPSSISFLKDNGLNLNEIKENGIPIAEFSKKFIQVLRSHQGLQWVTFHGNYDLAYLFKLVTRMSMPNSASEFARISGEIFGAIYDVKYIAQHCHKFLDRGIGLEKMSKIFKIERHGGAHHAGSDCLLTSELFHKLITCFDLVVSEHEGYLFGMSCRFMRKLMGRPVIRYCQPMVVGRRPVIRYGQPIVVGRRPVVRYCQPIEVLPHPIYNFAPPAVHVPPVVSANHYYVYRK
ncbi:hypothetical protein UlMin_038579 [Ulmus minor]